MRFNKKVYSHRLTAMGDSMAQGFKNGGIYRTDLSFPSLLASALGTHTRFDTPSFSGQGGLPLNLEVLVRGLSEQYGTSISWNEYLPVARYLYATLRRIKGHWENEYNHLRRPPEDFPYQNQAVWGFAANDCWLMTEKKCREYIRQNKPRYSVFSVLPDHAMYTTGGLVLNRGFNPVLENNSQVDNLVRLHAEGGVENLVLCTGHNNIVGALTALKISYTQPGFMSKHHYERDFTVYRPEHFEEEMRHLYDQIAIIGIPNVFVPTYPYLTIPPVTRGVNAGRRSAHTGYFDYYTRFWIWDEDFDPDRHPHLTKAEAIELDQLVDRYNEIIRNLAGEYGFHVVPVHKYVNAVARRRKGIDAVKPYPDDFIQALKRNTATAHLVTADGRVNLSTDYLRVDEKTQKVVRGGIFSLDGLHPSTIGYGLMANIYRMSMIKAGVRFEHPVDWDFVIEQETLISDPPPLLAELRLLLRFLSMDRQERFTRLGQNILQQLLDTFSRSPGEKLSRID
ncbi:MAG: hypothetical protein WEC12_04550 [Balneolaceae bacterium]